MTHRAVVLLVAGLVLPWSAAAQSGDPGGCGCGCGGIRPWPQEQSYDFWRWQDDFDLDGIEDEFDNCPFVSNYSQADADADLVGDPCDVCVTTPDPGQSDIDRDGFGDLCDPDLDGDLIPNQDDNCPLLGNNAQVNTDGDDEGDACDANDDNDANYDSLDDCRLLDLGAQPPVPECEDDADMDGVLGGEDNCPGVPNPPPAGEFLQVDTDGDGEGDVCDWDRDGDGVPDFADNCLDIANPSQLDADRDGVGDGGDWQGGAESCDSHECYVFAGDDKDCLDPDGPFDIHLLAWARSHDHLTGAEIFVEICTNRRGQLHMWSSRFVGRPEGREPKIFDGSGSGTSDLTHPQLTGCARLAEGSHQCELLNNIRFVPIEAGEYSLSVVVTLPGETGEDHFARETLVIAVEEWKAAEGCGCTGTPTLVAALIIGLLALTRRRPSGR